MMLLRLPPTSHKRVALLLTCVHVETTLILGLETHGYHLPPANERGGAKKRPSEYDLCFASLRAVWILAENSTR